MRKNNIVKGALNEIYLKMFPGGKDEENIQTSQLNCFLGQRHSIESVNQALCYVLSSIILSNKKDLNEILKNLYKRWGNVFSLCDMQTIIFYAVQNNQIAIMLVDKKYLVQNPSNVLEDFAEAWRTLNVDLIIKHLDSSFIYDSQWVFSSLDCKSYIDYLQGKFLTLKDNNTKLFVSIVPDNHSELGMMLRICQNGKAFFYRITIVNGKVTKGDLCAF